MKLFILGASGGVGAHLVRQAAARGHHVTAQTRAASNVPAAVSVRVVTGSPTDPAFLTDGIAGHDGVVFAIGLRGFGRTTLFSDATRAVVTAMAATGVRRLVAITGVGAGQSKGHGGWLYNHVVYPLFTRNRYDDKDRQEAIIETSDLDWTIVRPAPFSSRPATSLLQVVTEIPPDLQLRSVTREEVATFVLDALDDGRFVRQKPFIGHR